MEGIRYIGRITKIVGFFKNKRGIQWEAYLYLLPALIGFIVFQAGAMIYTFVISFTEWDIITSPKWVFLEQYSRIIHDALFWKVVWNTLYYIMLVVPLNLILSLSLALIVNKKLKGITIFRSIYFVPVVASMVAVAVVWGYLLESRFGAINYYLLLLFHVKGPNWLGSTTWALPSLALVSIWKGAGFNMVILLAGLQGIHQELYEAAKIDGANKLHQFRYVTLSLLSPTIFFVLIISVVSSFQVFDLTYIITQGGPAYSTLTLSFWTYQHAFAWFQIGRAAALAIVLFLVMVIFTLLQFKYQRRWVFYT